MFFYRTFVRFENVKLKNFVVLNKYEDTYLAFAKSRTFTFKKFMI